MVESSSPAVSVLATSNGHLTEPLSSSDVRGPAHSQTLTLPPLTLAQHHTRALSESFVRGAHSSRQHFHPSSLLSHTCTSSQLDMTSQSDAPSLPSSAVGAAAASVGSVDGIDAADVTLTSVTPPTVDHTASPEASAAGDTLSSVDDYSVLDVLTKPVLPRVQSASRYRRIEGEPTLAFFRRERNSLSAYCKPDSSSGETGGESGSAAGEDDWDEAMNRLEKRAVMSGVVRDDDMRGGYLGNDRRYEVRNQRVQREKRQSLKQMRAARLMQTLKFLLTMKGK